MSQLKTRVLLVEDEKDARKTLAFYLNTIFDEVIVAEDGQEGLNIFTQEEQTNGGFDLVLTDIKMPNVDGMEMIEEILKIAPKQRFIIVSAHKEEEHLLKLINLRVLGYFVKPLNIDNMMEMLEKAKTEVLEDKSQNFQTNTIELNRTYSYKLEQKSLFKEAKLVKLSKKEGQILDVLVQNRGEIVAIEKFKQTVWQGANINDTAVRTGIKRLKDKIRDDDFIVSHKGYGYIIEIVEA